MIQFTTGVTKNRNPFILKCNPEKRVIFSLDMTTGNQSLGYVHINPKTMEFLRQAELSLALARDDIANEFSYLLQIREVHTIRRQMMDLNPQGEP